MKTNLIIVMGVSGCGKTSIASSLASMFGYQHIEADDFHSEQAKQHMASGQALTDEMRLPWIEKLKQQLLLKSQQKESVVMSFSGLRRAHRMQLRNIFEQTVFVHLVAPYDTLLQRMSQRSDHFMPPVLLASQFDALESSSNEPDILEVDASVGIIQLIRETTARIDRHLT